MKKTDNKGFSLIELIIVIAIMAVLVAIIAPNLTKYLGKSKKSADSKNLDEIESTLKTCITDYEMDNGDLIATGGSSLTCAWSAGALSTTGNTTFDALVNEAIDATKTKSKQDSSKNAKAVITKNANGTYTIAMSWA